MQIITNSLPYKILQIIFVCLRVGLNNNAKFTNKKIYKEAVIDFENEFIEKKLIILGGGER